MSVSENISIDCGWGKLLFSSTFSSIDKLASELKKERKSCRNIAFAIEDVQILFSRYPQDFFLNPAYVYGSEIASFQLRKEQRKNFVFSKIQTEEEVIALNTIYEKLQMVPIRKNWISEKPKGVEILVAKEEKTKKIIGGVLFIDHFEVYADSEKTCSIWSLAVDPNTVHPGVGKGLVKEVLRESKRKKRKKLILSVVAENIPAVRMYEQMGFSKINCLTVKNKTPINEKLFTSQNFQEKFSPHVRGIVSEAQKRGIQVDLLTSDFYKLSFGGRSMRCQESLTELTNSIVVKSCNNHRLFTSLLEKSKIPLPESIITSHIRKAKNFLNSHGSIIVKTPVKGYTSEEITTQAQLQKEFIRVRTLYNNVVLQKFKPGRVYRFLVIDSKVVAIAKSKPPCITGDGKNSIQKLIQKISRRKKTLSSGESKLPLDSTTRSFLKQQGYSITDILPKGEEVQVRKTANYHSGGTQIDVTGKLPSFFSQSAQKIAKALSLSIADIEMVIPDIAQDEYILLAANAKPHFTYYQRKDVYAKYIDFLFPQTK